MILGVNQRTVIVIFVISIVGSVSSDSNEICSAYSGRRMYLDENGSGAIQAANVTASTLKNKVARVERFPDGTAIIHYHCQLELITCAGCIFAVNITNTQFAKTCDEGDTQCKCADYINFTEPPYEENLTEKMWCGRSPYEFRTRGRILVIDYVFQKSHDNPFNLTYVSEKNLLTYEGNVSANQTSKDDVLESPFFPNYYPRDLTIDHVIVCNSNYTIDCIIEIEFSDFQISLNSVMELYDEQDELIERYTGEIFRPPIIRLLTRLMRIHFNGNGGTGAGYRAAIRYLTPNVTEETVNTHCGGLVETFGGAITMMNMTNSSAMAYDCIWLIKPSNNYLHLKTHLLVRIDTFENMESASSVVIRDGSTSNSTMLKQYDWPIEGKHEKFQSFVTTLSSGFYISFKGVFSPESRFAIVYTAFSYMDCFPGPEFLCENHRCIPFFLSCDGFDHCGDGSDENERCGSSEAADEAETNQYWLTHTPNYFFPKIDHYPDLKTATLVFLASAMSLVMLILLLIMILYRMNHHVREQRELQSQLRTISELLDNSANNQNEENEAAQEEPPAYEEPPDYEEASSLKLDMTLRRSSTTILETHQKRRRSRSRSRSRCHSRQCEQNSLLNMPTCTPTPSEMLIPELYLTDREALAASIIECEISSRTQRRHSETVNVHSRRSSQILLIPDSPPPEYTPRHTKMMRKLSSSEQSFALDPALDDDRESNTSRLGNETECPTESLA
ncbi:uncharacterized protein LOC129576557 isoform X2 [Sitodiplosis mosellana]|uniref:uncharacterized protein LOC129576557 isoform X2 n=1 Tax=Sitodiplosis mosellana TaxID=263140 RepID=UPI0024443D0B|nr:uncharacterized protein LOC129576557 isoform X2 [Sitodiplosis mosellana]